jgi:hypothetical protein
MDLSTLPRYPFPTGERPVEPDKERDWRQFFAHLIVVSTVGLVTAALVAVLAIAFTGGQILWFLSNCRRPF